MNLNFIGIAVVSYLTGAVMVYAYMNRNRYVDIVLATIATFAFGTSSLLKGLGVLPFAALTLSAITQVFGVTAITLLAARIALGAYRAVKRYWDSLNGDE